MTDRIYDKKEPSVHFYHFKAMCDLELCATDLGLAHQALTQFGILNQK